MLFLKGLNVYSDFKSCEIKTGSIIVLIWRMNRSSHTSRSFKKYLAQSYVLCTCITKLSFINANSLWIVFEGFLAGLSSQGFNPKQWVLFASKQWSKQGISTGYLNNNLCTLNLYRFLVGKNDSKTRIYQWGLGKRSDKKIW